MRRGEIPQYKPKKVKDAERKAANDKFYTERDASGSSLQLRDKDLSKSLSDRRHEGSDSELDDSH